MADEQNHQRQKLNNSSGGERVFALTSHGRVVSNPNLLQGVVMGGETMERQQQQKQSLNWSDEDSSPQIDKTGNSSFNDFLYDTGAGAQRGRRTDNPNRPFQASTANNTVANNTSNDVPELTTEDDEGEVFRIAGEPHSAYLDDHDSADSRSTEQYVYTGSYGNGDVERSVDEEGKTKETFDSRDFKDRSDGYFDQSIDQIRERYDQQSSKTGERKGKMQCGGISLKTYTIGAQKFLFIFLELSPSQRFKRDSFHFILRQFVLKTTVCVIYKHLSTYLYQTLYPFFVNTR